jgi:hypothetical protein
LKDVLPTTPEARAVAALFHRREGMAWAPKDVLAFKAAVRRGVLTVEAMATIAAYYARERARGDEGKHRRDLKTFLHNFDGELDRAKACLTPARPRDDRPAAFRVPMNPPPERPAHAR